jgi:uncharacterized protein YggE
MTESRRAAVVLFLALTGAVAPARAQIFPPGMSGQGAGGDFQGMTVAGKASVPARPNLVEIDLEVGSASELTADAIVKYRDAKRRLHDAFAALKLEDVAVEERGLLVDRKGMVPNYYMGGMPTAANAKTEVQLTRKLVVKCSNIRGMEEDQLLQLIAKVLDVAQDAGARIGKLQDPYRRYYNPYDPYGQSTEGLVRFVVDDYDKLQEEAYEKAVADARARAGRLARLSRVELGPILAVRESLVPSDRVTPNPNLNPSDDEGPRKRLETSKLQDIPVRVELLVRFGVQPLPASNGRIPDK